jgi:hypothetical protein
METKNKQSVGQTPEQGQSKGVAAVANGSVLRQMDPQPNWHEEPIFDGDSWGARYVGATCSAYGEPEQTVGEDWHKAPDDMRGAKPVEHLGYWYWSLPNKTGDQFRGQSAP